MKFQNITIHTIAKSLHIRPARLRTKAEKMSLPIGDKEELVIEDAIQLLQSYVTSKRTGAATRQRAQELLEKLDGKNTVVQRRTQITSQQDNRCTMTKWNIVQQIRTALALGVQALHSSYFKFVALFVAISVQMHHSANWFHRVAPAESASWLSAWGYAFMVDLFVLVITLEGRLNIARTFAGLMFLANLLYFQFWIDFDGTAVAWTKAVSSVVISGVIAYVIFAYTEIFVRTQTE